jgi:hypothetical protein
VLFYLQSLFFEGNRLVGSLVKEERDVRRAEEFLRRGEEEKKAVKKGRKQEGERYLEECSRRRRPAA